MQSRLAASSTDRIETKPWRNIRRRRMGSAAPGDITRGSLRHPSKLFLIHFELGGRRPLVVRVTEIGSDSGAAQGIKGRRRGRSPERLTKGSNTVLTASAVALLVLAAATAITSRSASPPIPLGGARDNGAEERKRRISVGKLQPARGKIGKDAAAVDQREFITQSAQQGGGEAYFFLYSFIIYYTYECHQIRRKGGVVSQRFSSLLPLFLP